MLSTTAPVVIAGGGVIGAAVARELSLRGIPALVVEAQRLASGASGRAAGLLTPPPSATWQEPLGALLRRSFQMHLQLATQLPADSGIDYDFCRYPSLRVAETEAQERALRREAQDAARDGGPERWLGAAAARAQLGPLAHAADAPLRGALLGAPAAQLDPARFTLALLTDAQRHGAQFRIGRVGGLTREADRLTAVRIDGRAVPARTLVVAMGPWSARAAPWLGLPVPVEPLKGQILRLSPIPGGPTSTDPAPGRPNGASPAAAGFGDLDDNYAAIKPSGLVYIGTSQERAGFDTTPTAAVRDRILAWGRRRLPLLARAQLVAHTACLRPLSADTLPILGPIPGLHGAFLATGHGRKGLLLAPVTGRLLAEWIVDGRPHGFDPAPFAPQRFPSP